SEEHTSELQSLTNLVCRLLLEKIQSDVRWSSPLEEREQFVVHLVLVCRRETVRRTQVVDVLLVRGYSVRAHHVVYGDPRVVRAVDEQGRPVELRETVREVTDAERCDALVRFLQSRLHRLAPELVENGLGHVRVGAVRAVELRRESLVEARLTGEHPGEDS